MNDQRTNKSKPTNLSIHERAIRIAKLRLEPIWNEIPENEKKQIIAKQTQALREHKKLHTPFDCEFLVLDQLGFPICLHDRDCPGDCAPNNCPFVEEILNERNC